VYFLDAWSYRVIQYKFS